MKEYVSVKFTYMTPKSSRKGPFHVYVAVPNAAGTIAKAKRKFTQWANLNSVYGDVFEVIDIQRMRDMFIVI